MLNSSSFDVLLYAFCLMNEKKHEMCTKKQLAKYIFVSIVLIANRISFSAILAKCSTGSSTNRYQNGDFVENAPIT